MTQADRIRQFALDRYIVPARTRHDAEIVIRAGDVRRDMGLVSAMPAVCSALGGRKFEERACDDHKAHWPVGFGWMADKK
jgi:hypothetical protein